MASLRREEGSTPRFSLVLLDEEEEGIARHERLSLVQHVPLTAESLLKLSAGCAQDTAAVAISGSPSSGFNIWGIIFMRPPPQVFADLGVNHEFSLDRPDCLRVTTVSPGSLLITRGYAQIGRFVLGEFTPSRPTPFVSRAMGGHIMAALGANSAYTKLGTGYWHHYRNALDCLLAAAASRAHGGTIIVLPAGASFRHLIRSRYPCRGPVHIGALIERLTEYNEESSLVDSAYRKALSERLRSVAQLASIDGALLLNDDLEPLAFGVTLDAPTWAGSVIVGPDGFSEHGEPFDISRLGTRHNSAANFIGACPDAFGFVLSQDGPIRGLKRRDEMTLWCWPDCTVSMFA